MQHIMAADGLPTNYAKYVLQDHLGFLWIATESGLVRYDGYAFTHYFPKAGDPTSIGGSDLWTLFEDAAGDIWIGAGGGGGLSRFDRETELFVRYRHDPDDPRSLSDNEVRGIYESRREPGVLWIGTEKGGLNRLEIATGEFRLYLPGEPARLLVESRDGTYWVAGWGLLQFDPASGTFTRHLPDPRFLKPDATEDPGNRVNDILSIYEDPDGVMWAGSRHGLLRFDRRSGTFRQLPPLTTDSAVDLPAVILDVRRDRRGTFWVGTEGGLYTFDPTSERFTPYAIRPVKFLNHEPSVHRIYEDRFGVLWVASEAALVRLDPVRYPFSIYQHNPDDSNGLSENLIRAIHEDRNGFIWIGNHNNGILDRLDRNSGHVAHYDLSGQVRAGITEIFDDSSGILWVGFNGDGLKRFDQRSGQVTHYLPDSKNPNSLSDALVRDVLEDHTGHFWVATWFGGLDRMDRKTGLFTHFRPDPNRRGSLASEQVMVLYEDRGGTLWVGHALGISRFHPDTETFTNYVLEDLPFVMGILEDREGRFWITTVGGGGLHLFDRESGTSRALTTDDGLPHNMVRGILEDDQGFLWLGTENGLSKFDPRTETFRNFYTRDGLPSNGFRQNAAIRSKSGEMFFGGWQGVISFFPEQITTDEQPPQVALTRLRISGEHISPSPTSALHTSIMVAKEVKLTHNQNDITFEFVGLHYLNSVENRYRYMLKGYDTRWVEAGTQRTARYPQLPPGEYVFLATAANADGVWNDVGATVRVIVLPPWWETMRFRLLGIACVLSLIYGLYRSRIRAMRLRASTLETTVIERTAEVERQKVQIEGQARKLIEIDQLKSRFFANISHEFRTPLTLILGPVESALAGRHGPLPDKLQEELSYTRRHTHRLLHLVSQLLDLARFDSGKMTLQATRGDLVAFLSALVRSFTPFAERKKISLHFRAGVERQPLAFDSDKIEKVFANLLSNALKFTPEGGKVWVTIETCCVGSQLGESFVEVIVKDTGPGIPGQSLERVFDRFEQVDGSATRAHEGAGIGLALVKELVDLHGGKILVESEEGVGSAFIVRLPREPDDVPKTDFSTRVADEADPAGIAVQSPADARFLNEGWQLNGDGVDFSEPLSEREQSPTPTEGVSEAPESSAGGAYCVLVVEDNADVRSFLRSELENQYHVLEAPDGERGFEAVGQHKPDLVIADVMMPQMDGYAFCRKLKEDATLRHIPVILLTARATEEDTIHGLGSGADDYIIKPFRPAELRARVERLIESRRQLRKQFSRELVLQPAGMIIQSEDEAFLDQVVTYLNKHLAESNLSVDVLSEWLGVSRRKLERRMKKVTGEAPAELIRRLRLERAAQLLKGHAGSVAEVAYSVGFKSASHFAVAYREHFGISPSDDVQHAS